MTAIGYYRSLVLPAFAPLQKRLFFKAGLLVIGPNAVGAETK